MHNKTANRFELCLAGTVAFVTYREEPGRIICTHTQVPDALSGRGIAAALTQQLLDYAAAHNLQVIPQCSYTKAYMQKRGLR
jgi:predicted GNAT family acetyltransferase